MAENCEKLRDLNKLFSIAMPFQINIEEFHSQIIGPDDWSHVGKLCKKKSSSQNKSNNYLIKFLKVSTYTHTHTHLHTFQKSVVTTFS